jgi:hypothetical protein
VKCEQVDWYIVVFDRKTKLIYSTNTQQDAFLKEVYLLFMHVTVFNLLLDYQHSQAYNMRAYMGDVMSNTEGTD